MKSFHTDVLYWSVIFFILHSVKLLRIAMHFYWEHFLFEASILCLPLIQPLNFKHLGTNLPLKLYLILQSHHSNVFNSWFCQILLTLSFLLLPLLFLPYVTFSAMFLLPGWSTIWVFPVSGVKPFFVISWVTRGCHGCLDLCDCDFSFNSAFLKFY